MHDADTTSTSQVLWMLAAGAAVMLAIVILWVARKGRLQPGPHVFKASRLSRGNHLFPTQVAVTSTSLTLYRPQWIGKFEESIHMAHIASIKIDTHVLFADVTIETSGGQDPVICHGHLKGDAVEMKRVIEEFQSALYSGKSPVMPQKDAGGRPEGLKT
jgi:hypothetical protein